jgi:hypothetical protein
MASSSFHTAVSCGNTHDVKQQARLILLELVLRQCGRFHEQCDQPGPGNRRGSLQCHYSCLHTPRVSAARGIRTHLVESKVVALLSILLAALWMYSTDRELSETDVVQFQVCYLLCASNCAELRHRGYANSLRLFDYAILPEKITYLWRHRQTTKFMQIRALLCSKEDNTYV